MLHYFEEGSGPPLILLHGTLNAGRMLFAPFLEPLGRRYRLIVPDLRGQGESARLRDKPYTIEQMAKDVIELAEHLGVDRFSLVGFSLGGAVSLEIARQRPQAVERLVLIASFAYKPASFPEWLSGIVAPPFIRLVGIRGLSALLPLVASVDEEAMVGWRSYLRDQSADQISAIFQSIHRFDARPWLGGIQQPVLLIASDPDPVVPPYHSRTLHTLLPHSRLVVLPSTGHSMIHDEKEKITELVFDFMKEKVSS